MTAALALVDCDGCTVERLHRVFRYWAAGDATGSARAGPARRFFHVCLLAQPPLRPRRPTWTGIATGSSTRGVGDGSATFTAWAISASTGPAPATSRGGRSTRWPPTGSDPGRPIAAGRRTSECFGGDDGRRLGLPGGPGGGVRHPARLGGELTPVIGQGQTSRPPSTTRRVDAASVPVGGPRRHGWSERLVGRPIERSRATGWSNAGRCGTGARRRSSAATADGGSTRLSASRHPVRDVLDRLVASRGP
jgi:hypothetical protein